MMSNCALGSGSPPPAGIHSKEGHAAVEAECAEGGGGDGARHAAPRRRPLRRHAHTLPTLHLKLPQLAHQRPVEKFLDIHWVPDIWSTVLSW